MNDYGFIMTRHVTNEITNKYWIEAYNCIRNIHTDIPIIIIDNNSDLNYLTNENNLKLVNCTIIKCEFYEARLLTAYYYFYKLKPFKKAIIIHDSVFVHTFLDFSSINDIKFLWDFKFHGADLVALEKVLINSLNNNNELHVLHDNKNSWNGCMGVMSVITLEFLEKIESKYNIFNMIKIINNNLYNQALERVFAVICTNEIPELKHRDSLIGDVELIGFRWDYKFDNYIADKNNNIIIYPYVKVLTTRL